MDFPAQTRRPAGRRKQDNVLILGLIPRVINARHFQHACSLACLSLLSFIYEMCMKVGQELMTNQWPSCPVMDPVVKPARPSLCA